MRKYSFFYHYYKQKKAMSVHFKGVCHIAQDVVCNVPCETKWNKRQPELVMKGKCTSLLFERTPKGNIIYIS